MSIENRSLIKRQISNSVPQASMLSTLISFVFKNGHHRATKIRTLSLGTLLELPVHLFTSLFEDSDRIFHKIPTMANKFVE